MNIIWWQNCLQQVTATFLGSYCSCMIDGSAAHIYRCSVTVVQCLLYFGSLLYPQQCMLDEKHEVRSQSGCETRQWCVFGCGLVSLHSLEGYQWGQSSLYVYFSPYLSSVFFMISYLPFLIVSFWIWSSGLAESFHLWNAIIASEEKLSLSI